MFYGGWSIYQYHISLRAQDVRELMIAERQGKTFLIIMKSDLVEWQPRKLKRRREGEETEAVVLNNGCMEFYCEN